MTEAVCKEFSPQINKMLVDYALEKGVRVYHRTLRDNGCPSENMLYIVFADGQIQRSRNTENRKELTVGEFLSFIDELSKPKLKLAGHDVEFSDFQVKVGCTILSHNEIKEFIKEYQTKFGE